VNTFKHRYSDGVEDTLNIGELISGGNLTNAESVFLREVREAWNFYEGYHWEGIDDLDTPQVTFNYCQAFINKFVAFELGKGFTIQTPTELDKTPVTINDPIKEVTLDEDGDGVIESEEVTEPKEKTIIRERTIQEFLNQVWEYNNRDQLLVELGQTKSITGEAWVKVHYQSKEELAGLDPFQEYPMGKVRLSVVPTQYVFPRFNDHDRTLMDSLLIMYPIHVTGYTGFLRRRLSESTVLYKEVWTRDEIVVYEGDRETDRMTNPYGFIPFVQIKNFPVAGRTRGASDIDNIIPLNVELNTKKSDVSEIIDYHSAPITLVYGAKIGNLEKGANKVWGGLPKDSKVENLALQGDLAASSMYIKDVKTSMCEIAGIPETVLGGAAAISNTSGVALQYMNLPLIERTTVKRALTSAGLVHVNKMVLFVALHHGLIQKPDDITMKDFVTNTVDLPDTLPKDELIELQKIQQEMLLGLECRHGAMERLGKDNITKRLAEIDKERHQFPELFNPALQQMIMQNRMNTNAGGMLNGQTPQEQMRIETTGQNGGAQPQ